MGSREEILQAVGEAASLVREFPLGDRTCIDLVGVVEELDIPVVFRPLNSLLGAVVAVDETNGILVNAGPLRQVQRFTLAHELGHILLDHETNFDEEVGVNQRSRENGDRPSKETAADTFASKLLAPLEILVQNMDRQQWNQQSIQRPETIYQLSLRLGLSFPATCWALVDNDLLDRKIAKKYTRQRDVVKEAKSSLVPDTISRDSWADVWSLSECDAGTHLEASENDVFAVHVEDRSSSGYLWDIPEEDTDLEILEKEIEVGAAYGSSSKNVFYLTFESQGIHTLKLQHKRPWNNSMIEEIEITIDNWGREDEGLPRRERQNNLTRSPL